MIFAFCDDCILVNHPDQLFIRSSISIMPLTSQDRSYILHTNDIYYISPIFTDKLFCTDQTRYIIIGQLERVVDTAGIPELQEQDVGP
jgi:hypothetical protein